jgi:hypothetical protein
MVGRSLSVADCTSCDMYTLRSNCLIILFMSDSDVIWAGRLGFDSQHLKEISLFTASRLVLGRTQPAIKYMPGDLPSRIKRLGRDIHHSHPPSAEVKNGGDILPFPDTSSWQGATLFMHRHNLTVCILTSEESHSYLSMALQFFLLDLGRFFSFLILYIVGWTPLTGDQPVAKLLPAHRHPCLECDSNPRSQFSSERRQLMTSIARPLWSAEF